MKYEIVFFCLFLSFLFLIPGSCKKEPNSVELIITEELPVIYGGCLLKEGNSAIIKDKIGLDTIFTTNLVNQTEALQNIDFSKYNLLVGATVYTRGIYKLEHSLVKISNSEFIYTVKVYYDLTLPAGTFYYGILIDKLPLNASVKFVITRINE
jgi:hypothetical protein